MAAGSRPINVHRFTLSHVSNESANPIVKQTYFAFVSPDRALPRGSQIFTSAAFSKILKKRTIKIKRLDKTGDTYNIASRLLNGRIIKNRWQAVNIEFCDLKWSYGTGKVVETADRQFARAWLKVRLDAATNADIETMPRHFYAIIATAGTTYIEKYFHYFYQGLLKPPKPSPYDSVSLYLDYPREQTDDKLTVAILPFKTRFITKDEGIADAHIASEALLPLPTETSLAPTRSSRAPPAPPKTITRVSPIPPNPAIAASTSAPISSACLAPKLSSSAIVLPPSSVRPPRPPAAAKPFNHRPANTSVIFAGTASNSTSIDESPAHKS